jgi:hypothetical protein
LGQTPKRRHAIVNSSSVAEIIQNAASAYASDFCVEIAVQACLRSTETNKRLSENLEQLEKDAQEWLDALRIEDDDEMFGCMDNTALMSQTRGAHEGKQNPNTKEPPQQLLQESRYRSPYVGCPVAYGSVIALKAIHGGYLTTDFGRHCSTISSEDPCYLQNQCREVSNNNNEQLSSLFTIWSANTAVRLFIRVNMSWVG